MQSETQQLEEVQSETLNSLKKCNRRLRSLKKCRRRLKIFEEVQPETQELENTLAGEDDDEGRVNDVQCVVEVFRLLVVFEAHDDHVE